MIDIYTDGSCQGNPGHGGWAAIIVEGNRRQVISGQEDKTTNNRMELLAAIRGLDAVPKDASVTVHSDSQYLINTMTRDWKRKANRDLWAQLDGLTSGWKVQWKWVRGHDGHPENEEANVIAGREAGVLPKSPGLTHIDQQGHAQMVDVGAKVVTQREAVARGLVLMRPETLALIMGGKVVKGDVLATARLAGIMGAKQTPQLIPLCHPIPLGHVTVDLVSSLAQIGIEITAKVKTEAKTGVEMEALTAVSVAALTIYDMCKSLDPGIRIHSVRLVSKRGGKSGDIVLEN